MEDLAEFFWLIPAAIAGIGLFITVKVSLLAPDHRDVFFGVLGLIVYPAMIFFSIRFYRVRRGERLSGETHRRAPWE
jgi:hypothetical protein